MKKPKELFWSESSRTYDLVYENGSFLVHHGVGWGEHFIGSNYGYFDYKKPLIQVLTIND